MDKVLIVTSTQKSRAFFAELKRTPAFQNASIVESGAQARRILIEADYDIVVVNAPLSDAAKAEDYGVFVVAKPVNRQLFSQSLRIVSASRKRMLNLQNENVRLQQKIQEIRMVDRAKCALIQYLHMSEPDAHRYIEKQAMDLRITRREVAEEILKTYES